jgi:ABC-2 type transport system permease protein
LIWVSSFILINAFRQGQEYEARTAVMLLLSMIPFQLFFLMVGMAISLLLKRVRNVLPITMGLVFGLYILNAFGSMIGEKSLEVISPFKHFTPSYIIQNAGWDWELAWISPVLIVIALVASYLLYARRNIASAV